MSRFAISDLLVEFDRAKAYTDALWRDLLVLGEVAAVVKDVDSGAAVS